MRALAKDSSAIAHQSSQEQHVNIVSYRISILSLSCITNIIVAAVTNRISPVIKQPPQNITGTLFSTVTLTCLAEGFPQPQIHWFKDGIRLRTQSSTSSELMIEELTPSTRGFYYCEAVNSADTVRSKDALVNIRGSIMAISQCKL